MILTGPGLTKSKKNHLVSNEFYTIGRIHK